MRRPVKSPYRITTPFNSSHPATDYAGLIPGVPQRVYAPVSGTAQVVYQDRCGKTVRILVDGKRRHTMCHLSVYGVNNLQKVTEGQYLGWSGNTGSASNGVHVHHVAYDERGNKIDWEKKLKEEEMVTLRGLQVIYRFRLGIPPTDYGMKNLLGKVTFDEADNRVLNSDLYKRKVAETAENQTVNLNQLPSAYRRALKEEK